MRQNGGTLIRSNRKAKATAKIWELQRPADSGGRRNKEVRGEDRDGTGFASRHGVSEDGRVILAFELPMVVGRRFVGKNGKTSTYREAGGSECRSPRAFLMRTAGSPGDGRILPGTSTWTRRHTACTPWSSSP